MHVIAERRDRINGFHNIVPKVPRMRGREPHPAYSGNLSNGSQQLRKRLFFRRIPIRVYVLAEQLNLAIAKIGHLPGLGEHGLRCPAAFLAAGKRHHAVGTELVASLDDRDVAAVRIGAGGKLGLETLIGLAVVETGNTNQAADHSPGLIFRNPSFELCEHLGQIPIGSRPAHQRDMRRTLKDLLAFLLRDASEHAESLSLRFELLEIGQAMKHLLLGLVADRAGVVQNQIRLLDGLDLPIPLL